MFIDIGDVGDSLLKRVTVFLFCLSSLVFLSSCMGAKKTATDYSVSEKKNIVMQSSETGEQKKVVASCPTGMILIPGGPTLFGPQEESGRPAQPGARGEIKPTQPFCVDRFEWPNKNNEVPLRNIAWLEAQEFCKKAGKQLCTEMEFEKACRGPVGTTYTYGDGYSAKACAPANSEYTVGSVSTCVSGFGVYDMSGGVFEWTATAPADNAQQRYLRGGLAPDTAEQSAKCTYRVRYGTQSSNKDVGFRCCAPITVAPLAKE